MKKRLLSLAFLFTVVITSAFSQAAVIDLGAIAAAIENGVTMYNQLQTTYNQYKNMVSQLKNIEKDLKSFDVSEYDWKNWESILKMTDHYMSQMDNIDNLINRKSMKIGKMRFSMKDLYTTDFYDNIGDDVLDEINPENISESQKMQFYKKHGLSVKHYCKLRAINEQIHENAVRTAARIQIMKEDDEIVMEQIGDFKKATGRTSGTVDNLQLAAKIQAQNLEETKQISTSIRDMSQQFLEKNLLDITEKEADKENEREQYRHNDIRVHDFYKQAGNESNLMGPGNFKPIQRRGK